MYGGSAYGAKSYGGELESIKYVKKTLTEGVAFVATVKKKISAHRNEIIKFASLVVKESAKSFVETIAVQSSKTISTVRNITESFSVQDFVSKGRYYLLIEIMGFSDQIKRVTGKAILESLSITDKITKELHVVLNESMLFLSYFVRSWARNLSEIIGFSDSFLKRTGRELSEIMNFVGILKKTIATSKHEGVSFQDLRRSFAQKSIMELIKYHTIFRGAKWFKPILQEVMVFSQSFTKNTIAILTETIVLIPKLRMYKNGFLAFWTETKRDILSWAKSARNLTSWSKKARNISTWNKTDYHD